MPTLLTPVKSSLFIAARRRSWGMLDGEYASVFRGRSLDYDDLRDYVPGDEIRDIDWKATARHGSPLVKRYVATRKQTVLFVVDTGRSMAAHGPTGESKADVAVRTIGILGYLALRHGDLVGLAWGDADGAALRRPGDSEANLEGVLQQVAGAVSLEAARSDLVPVLAKVADQVRQRMLVVVVSDDRDLGDDALALVRRLQAQHELLWVSVDDADPTVSPGDDLDTLDVASGLRLPDEVRGDPALRAAYAAAMSRRRERLAESLRREGIVHGHVSGTAGALGTVVDLLQRQRRHGR